MIYEYKEAAPDLWGAADEPKTIAELCNSLAKEGWEPVLVLPHISSTPVHDNMGCPTGSAATHGSFTLLFRRPV